MGVVVERAMYWHGLQTEGTASPLILGGRAATDRLRRGSMVLEKNPQCQK